MLHWNQKNTYESLRVSYIIYVLYVSAEFVAILREVH